MSALQPLGIALAAWLAVFGPIWLALRWWDRRQAKPGATVYPTPRIVAAWRRAGLCSDCGGNLMRRHSLQMGAHTVFGHRCGKCGADHWLFAGEAR